MAQSDVMTKIGCALTLVIGFIYLAMDIVILLYHHCAIDVDLSLSYFNWFYVQYLVSSCSSVAKPVFYVCEEGLAVPVEGNPNAFNDPDNVAIWIYVHLALTCLWIVSSLIPCCTPYKVVWHVTTAVVLVYSLLATIVLSVDFSTIVDLSSCASGTDVFTYSLVSSLILPLYFSQGGFIFWIVNTICLVLSCCTRKRGTRRTTKSRRVGRTLSDAPSEMMNRRYNDPARTAAPFTPPQTFLPTPQPAPEVTQPKTNNFTQMLNSEPEENMVNTNYMMYKSPPEHGNQFSEFILSPNHFESNQPESSSAPRKPSLIKRQDSNEAKSPYGQFNRGFSTSDQSDVIAPFEERPFPAKSYTNPMTSRTNSRPLSPTPSIPRVDYSPPVTKPRIVSKTMDQVGRRQDKAPRKAIRTPSGRSFTATEYLKGYKPAQESLREEETGVVRYFTPLKR